MNESERINEFERIKRMAKSEVLELSTDILPLSVRAYNVLRKFSTFNRQSGQFDSITIKDLCKLTDYEVLSQKNCGKKTLIEINNQLKELGLSLKEYVPKRVKEILNVIRTWNEWEKDLLIKQIQKQVKVMNRG